jgi:SH3-like domain-containing protein
MNMPIRLSRIFSGCLVACSVFVLLSAPAGYAETANTSKKHAGTKTGSAKTKVVTEKKESGKTKESIESVSVLKDGTNVRTGPDLKDPVAMELFQGYPLKVVEKKGEWIKVSDFENDSGWINDKMVGPGNTVIVSAKSTINMRSEPKESGAVVANIEHGVVLTRISSQGDWVKVKHTKGIEGWISKKLLWP